MPNDSGAYRLILIKHSNPCVEADVSSDRWDLSAEGLRRCEPLARSLEELDPELVIASEERKARQTARRVAELLNLSWRTATGLEEQDRRDVGLLESSEELESRVAWLFSEPARPVFGRESADAAHRRFSIAIDGVLAEHPERRLAVVTHGTVIALFVARANGLDPFELWKRLTLPSFVELALPGLELRRGPEGPEA